MYCMKNIENCESRVLLTLLAHELFGTEIEISAADVDWHSLLNQANDHVITPLLYSGIQQAPDVPQDVFDMIERSAVRSTIQAERMGQIQSELFTMLDNAGIKAAILKGTSLAMNYPHSEVRITGDIDILVDTKSLDKCGDLLIHAGYILEEVSDIHVCYRKKHVLVEVHQAVSRYPQTAKGVHTNKLMEKALDNTRIGNMKQYEFPMLIEPFYSIVLLSHMERHMGTAGIGLRQLCDWAMAVHALREEEGRHLISVWEECGLLKYAQVLTEVCSKYLMMPKCEWMPKCSEDLTEETMEDILSVGNFQAQHSMRPYGSAMIDPYDLKGDGKRRLLDTYFRRVKRTMQNEYSWAKSKIWVPVFGLYYFGRWAGDVLRGRIPLKSTLNTMKAAKERERLMRKMQLYK